MANDMAYSGEQMDGFVGLLKNDLPDQRDNRGKRHSLVFVIVGFVLATLVGRQTLSGIHRYIANRVDWLAKLTQTEAVKPVSRAHLPRLLDRLDWPVLNGLINRCFGVRMECDGARQWVAVDGKALRGTLDAGDKQSLILAVSHDTREAVSQARQSGDKSSEIPEVRTLLKDSGLEKQKVSLDAHHLNPATLGQIHQAGRIYLVQAKENQPVFLQQCQALRTESAALAETVDHDKANGRVTTRRARLFSLASLTLDSRWNDSGLSALMVVEREAFDVRTKKTSYDTAYYASNAVAGASAAGSLAEELAQAVRGHWGVESNNWIRDATFGEDGVKTKAGNQAQVMGLLRGLAIELIRKTMPKNFQAAIDKFVDSPDDLKSMLLQVKFL